MRFREGGGTMTKILLWNDDNNIYRIKFNLKIVSNYNFTIIIIVLQRAGDEEFLTLEIRTTICVRARCNNNTQQSRDFREAVGSYCSRTRVYGVVPCTLCAYVTKCVCYCVLARRKHSQRAPKRVMSNSDCSGSSGRDAYLLLPLLYDFIVSRILPGERNTTKTEAARSVWGVRRIRFRRLLHSADNGEDSKYGIK